MEKALILFWYYFLKMIKGECAMNYFLVEAVLGISMIPFKDFSAFGCIANVVMLMPLGFFCRFYGKIADFSGKCL